jgi:hypothetical protein
VLDRAIDFTASTDDYRSKVFPFCMRVLDEQGTRASVLFASV